MIPVAPEQKQRPCAPGVLGKLQSAIDFPLQSTGKDRYGIVRLAPEARRRLHHARAPQDRTESKIKSSRLCPSPVRSSVVLFSGKSSTATRKKIIAAGTGRDAS